MRIEDDDYYLRHMHQHSPRGEYYLRTQPFASRLEELVSEGIDLRPKQYPLHHSQLNLYHHDRQRLELRKRVTAIASYLSVYEGMMRCGWHEHTNDWDWNYAYVNGEELELCRPYPRDTEHPDDDYYDNRGFFTTVWLETADGVKFDHDDRRPNQAGYTLDPDDVAYLVVEYQGNDYEYQYRFPIANVETFRIERA